MIDRAFHVTIAAIWWSPGRVASFNDPEYAVRVALEHNVEGASPEKLVATYQYVVDNNPEMLKIWAKLDPDSLKRAQRGEDEYPVSFWGRLNPLTQIRIRRAVRES